MTGMVVTAEMTVMTVMERKMVHRDTGDDRDDSDGDSEIITDDTVASNPH